MRTFIKINYKIVLNGSICFDLSDLHMQIYMQGIMLAQFT